ncbi:MAG: carboxypeptidase-like regulatory domain-containing protein [Bryobacteraceae bacterium]
MLRLVPRPLHRPLLISWILLFVSAVAWGQTASLRGQVVDQSGAVIPKAAVTLNGPSGLVKTTTTAENGSYSFQGLPPGEYTVQAAAPKLEQEPVPIVLKPGTQILRLELKVAAVQQQTTIQENANSSISTESANNASAVVLRGKDLESLADDPEDLGAHLQALAGPSAGPGGSSIFIDDSVVVSSHRRTPSAKSGSTRILFRLNTTSSAMAGSKS